MKKTYITAITVAILSFVVALTMGAYILITNLTTDKKYILHVGVKSTASSIETKITNVCKKHVDSYTIVKGSGGYTNDLGGFESETVYLLTLCFTNEATVKALAKEILETVDNSTVLMEIVQAKTDWYKELE